MATRSRLTLTALSALLVAAPAAAAVYHPTADQLDQIRAQEGVRAQQSLAHLEGLRAKLGLDTDSAFKATLVHTDALGQTHTHIQQLYRGVKVWGGEAVAHMDRTGAMLPTTSALKGGISLDTTPSFRPDEVLAFAHQDLAPRGAYASKPTAELVVFPILVQVHVGTGQDATSYEYRPVRYALAYHIHTDLQNGAGETKQTDYMIDAHTGAILKKWSSLETAASVGTGHSQYSGTVNINTNSTSSGYELRDMTRGTGGTFGNNVVTNLNHATSGNGTIYTDADNTWGDGANYVEGSSTTAANGETAAVDAAYGIQATWDMYKNVLGRNGIDGNGKSTYLRVHYSNSYDNAFWDDTCFCMTFGDGSSFTTLTSVDVAGHEMSHGVCANNGHGGLNYSGESGGLNESNSDVMGTMVEFYDFGGGEASGATTIPATGGNWTIGEQLSSSPLRYMYKPSLDGSSPDAYTSSIGNLDVHYSSGPGNREFYFLSQGSSSSSSSNYYSSYLPGGMAGVGNDHAARIHYRALTTYYTSTETYAQARTAHINAATDLYGANSPEVAAVENSFAAINVGSPASNTPNTVTASITTPSGNVTIATGTTQSFVGSGTDSSSSATLSYAWTFGDGSTATGASASHTYTNTGTTAVTYTATLKVTDNTGVSSTATRSITVNPAASGSNTVTASITTPSSNVTIASGTSQAFAGTGTDSASGQTLTYSWAFGDGTTGSGASTSHTYTNSGSTAVTYTATLTATDTTGAKGTATRTITVNPATSGGTQLITNGGFESGTTGWTQTSGVIGANGPSEPAHTGSNDAWLDGYGSSHTDYVTQQVTIAAGTSPTLSFYLHIDTSETTTTTAYDTLKVQVLSTSGTVLGTLATFSNLNAASGYTQHSYSLGAYAGKTVVIKFLGVEDSSLQTSFVLDDVSAK
ncbi:MAG TPA: M4 family metallopeptidase [Holophagaceae bacterium]|nr:M4 family metallopeptidase [Holophagaceae bacterium]